jgi:hypothetical protein
VLVKSPKGPEVSPSDMFKYNASFSNPLFRIKINNIQLKETAEENAKTNAEVGQGRTVKASYGGGGCCTWTRSLTNTSGIARHHVSYSRIVLLHCTRCQFCFDLLLNV